MMAHYRILRRSPADGYIARAARHQASASELSRATLEAARVTRRQLGLWAVLLATAGLQWRHSAHAQDPRAVGAPITADTTLVRADASTIHADQ